MVPCFKSNNPSFRINNHFELRYEYKFYHLFGFIMFHLNKLILFYRRVGYVNVTNKSGT